MANYRPAEAEQMTTPLKLLIPSPNSKIVNGVPVNEFIDAEDPIFLASFKTYGGTEQNINGVYSIRDTASIVCFYRPDIKSNCKIVRLTDNAVFKVLAEPENVDERNQFLKFRVERIKGGV